MSIDTMEWINYTKPQYIRDLAKKLRREETEAEKILRKQLRNKQLDGYKFHRQKAIFAYKEENGRNRFFIADFYHHPQKLIIEIDGNIHKKKEVQEYDQMREEILF